MAVGRRKHRGAQCPRREQRLLILVLGLQGEQLIPSAQRGSKRSKHARHLVMNRRRSSPK